MALLRHIVAPVRIILHSPSQHQDHRYAKRKAVRYAILRPMKTATRTYTLAIEKHPDGYLAYFPALAGCHTWGSTHEEAVVHAEEALAVYLETVAASGDSLPEDLSDEPVSLGVTVRTPVIA